MYLTISCFVLVCLHFSRATPFIECGPGSVTAVSIKPCEGVNLCNLVLGTVVSVSMEFVSPISTDAPEELIKGIVRGRELPFPEPKKNPCSGYITPGCPLVTGSSYKFTGNFTVKPFYPAIPIEMKYSLLGPGGEMIMCFRVSTKIVDPNPKAKGGRRRG